MDLYINGGLFQEAVKTIDNDAVVPRLHLIGQLMFKDLTFKPKNSILLND